MMQGRRLADVQAMMRQAGRLRTGYSTPTTSKSGKAFNRPERSETFILSSLQKELIDAAARRWGGEPELWTPQGTSIAQWRVTTQAVEIDAILPPGNPLSTMYELWKAGDCIRRCDGVKEDKSGKPCLCKAQFGELWYEQEPTVPPKVCKITGRLNVFLELGVDFGYWRLDVHSFFAVAEMSGAVDMIRGFLGPAPGVRIRLAIEQRPDGKSTYPVVAIRMTDQVALQILSGITPPLMLEAAPTGQQQPAMVARQVRELTAAGEPPPPALPPQEQAGSAEEGGAAPVDWGALFAAATSMTTLRERWRECYAAGDLNPTTKPLWFAAANKLRANEAAAPAEAAPEPPPPPPPDGDAEPPDDDQLPAAAASPAQDSEPIDGDLEPDRAAVWRDILNEAQKRGWKLPDASRLMREHVDVDPTDADGFDMANFLQLILDGKVTNQ